MKVNESIKKRQNNIGGLTCNGVVYLNSNLFRGKPQSLSPNRSRQTNRTSRREELIETFLVNYLDK